MTAPGRQPVSMREALNKIFGIDLPDSTAAYEWLSRHGGWDRLAVWLKLHRDDGHDEETETEETPL